MTSTSRRDAVVEMTRYLAQEFDAIPASEWLSVLLDTAQGTGERPTETADLVEQILGLVRRSKGPALPTAVYLAFATGAPPVTENIRAAALRPGGENDPVFDVQPDMLIAPDRHFSQPVEVSLSDGVLEIRLPQLHPGPHDGSALVWVGRGVGHARETRLWREQRDHLAAAQWRFENGDFLRPIDQTPSSLAATSLAEARFLRQVLAVPAPLLEASATGRGMTYARVPWPFDNPPILSGNPALIGVSGAQQLAVIYTATTDAEGAAEVRLSPGPARHFPVSIERTGSKEADLDSLKIPRLSGQHASAGWTFDPIDNAVLLRGLAPSETFDLRVLFRLGREQPLGTALPLTWTGPAALRWRLQASLIESSLAPAKRGPSSIVSAADLAAALRFLDPFPETLDIGSAEITAEPRIVVADGRLAVGHHVTVRSRRPASRGSLAEIEHALSAMLRGAIAANAPLRVRVHHDP